MKTTDTIRSTTNYNMFELHETNRTESRRPILAESMRRYGFLKSGAIHVHKNGRGKLKVIRGHHRLQEAMRQKLPVWYIVEDANVDIFALEGDKNQAWTVENWAEARASGGDEHCAKLLAFKRRHKLSLTTCAALVGGESAGSNNKQRRIKFGTFVSGDMSHANLVVRVVDSLDEIGIEFARGMQFVAALSAAARVPEFDAEHFIARARLFPKMMNRRATKSEYLQEMEALYNYKAQSKAFPLCYRTAEVGKERSAAQKKK